MSISTMVRLAHQSQQQQAEVKFATKGPGRKKAGPPRQGAEESREPSALEKLTAYVPTEIIAFWGAAVGLIIPTGLWQRWLIFGLAVAALGTLVLLEIALQDKEAKKIHREENRPGDPPRTGVKRALIMLSMTLAAFIVWVFATPESPAVELWGKESTRIFAVLAVPISAILYKLGRLLEIAPVKIDGA